MQWILHKIETNLIKRLVTTRFWLTTVTKIDSSPTRTVTKMVRLFFGNDSNNHKKNTRKHAQWWNIMCAGVNFERPITVVKLIVIHSAETNKTAVTTVGINCRCIPLQAKCSTRLILLITDCSKLKTATLHRTYNSETFAVGLSRNHKKQQE